MDKTASIDESIIKRHWWRRLSFAIEIRFSGVEGNEPGGKWFFSGEVTIDKTRKGRKVFWPRLWVKILGFTAGAGFYYDYDD